jgi:mono/diheme cytochrome c family protein
LSTIHRVLTLFSTSFRTFAFEAAKVAGDGDVFMNSRKAMCAGMLTAALTGLLATFGFGGGSTAFAQTPAPAGLWAGVYSAAQAEKGEATFSSLCSRCHNPDLSGGQVGASYAPALGGDKFMARWETNTVDRLFHTIRDTMPRGTPGMLNDDAALAVVAYILRFNGYPAGTEALTTGPSFDLLQFVPKEGTGGKREVGNFALVAVVGCLTEGTNRSWMLTNATDPVAAREGPSAGVAKDAALGSQTFRLVSVAPFRSTLQAGRAVQVKGLIRKDPDETMINVTAVDPVTSSCAVSRP